MGQGWFSKIITIKVINQLPYEVFVEVGDEFQRLEPYSPLHCTPPPFEHRPHCEFTVKNNSVFVQIKRITENGEFILVIPGRWYLKSREITLNNDLLRFINAKPASEEIPIAEEISEKNTKNQF